MEEYDEAPLSSVYFYVAGSTVSWTAVYLALARRRLWGQQSPEFYCRVVTVIHAFVAVALAGLCYWQGPDPYKYPGEANTSLCDFALSVSLGYFFYDLVWCLYHQTEAAIMIIHHICSIVSIGIVLWERTSGADAVQGIFGMELTNPLLQLRWFLRTAGYNNTRIHTVVELLFVCMFIVMRLLFGTYLTYISFASDKVKTDIKLCITFLYFVSLGFIFYIFQFFKKKYSSKRERDLD